MNEWERRVNRFLHESEAEFLKDYDRWLHSAFVHIPLGVDEHAAHAFHLHVHQRLSAILFKHSVAAFTAGQAQADEDCAALKKRRKRRLALPTITMRQATDDDFVPHDAIRILQHRAIKLAGEVESDIVHAIKNVLLKHLVGLPRQDTEKEIADLLQRNMNRASLIVTTETTYAYNRGRLISYRDNGVDYVMFRAIMDARTCGICSSRNGKIMALNDIGADIPPVHGRCRCVLSPVYSDLQPELMTKQALDWSDVEPLPKGWVS